MATGTDWKRLGRMLIARRVELGYPRRNAFASKAGFRNDRVLSDAENARRTNFSPATRAQIEQAYQWAPGSIDRILTGGDPVPTSTVGAEEEVPAAPQPSPPNEAVPDYGREFVPDPSSTLLTTDERETVNELIRLLTRARVLGDEADSGAEVFVSGGAGVDTWRMTAPVPERLREYFEQLRSDPGYGSASRESFRLDLVWTVDDPANPVVTVASVKSPHRVTASYDDGLGER